MTIWSFNESTYFIGGFCNFDKLDIVKKYDYPKWIIK